MDKIERVMLPYGKERFIEVNIPSKNFGGAFSSKRTLPISDLDNRIRGLLENPIAAKGLTDLAKEANNVLLVVDDNTRRTPVYKILPILMKILNDAEINNSNIKILFAAGTHREMTKDEKIEKIGLHAFNCLECIGHDYLGEHASFGATHYGTPVEVNPLLAWSDLTIAIGSIIPHPYCGWGGGGKMILPGVSSAKSILATHLLPFENPEIGIGVVENRARIEIDEASQMAGLRFIINTILNSDGEVVDIVAGAPVDAHRIGIKKSVKVNGVRIPTSDLIFGCSYPEYSCYWQANKAFHPMEIIIKPNGLAVMVASMPEGRGEHPSCFDAMGETVETLLSRLNAVKDSDLDEALAIACALADRKLQNKARVAIISDGLPFSDTAKNTFTRFNDPNEAVKKIISEKEDAIITCLLNAPEMLPIS